MFWPISDKRIYSLYRTLALLYIKLYNAKYPENLSYRHSQNIIQTWAFRATIEQSAEPEDDSSLVLLNNLKSEFNFFRIMKDVRVKLLQDLERVDGTNIWSREALKFTDQHPLTVNKEQLDGPPVLLRRSWSSMLM